MRALIALFIISVSFASQLEAKLFDLDQAANLMQVLDDVYDASLDTNNYFDITEREDVSPKDFKCERISNEMVSKRILKSFDILKEVYPDEYFPIEEARLELQFILGSSPYYYCPLPLEEDFNDIQFRDLYISMGSGISFIIESSQY